MQKLIYTIDKNYNDTSLLNEMMSKNIFSFRINLSRTSIEVCDDLVQKIRSCAKNQNANAYIIVDLPGIKFRTAKMQKTELKENNCIDIELCVPEAAQYFMVGDIVEVGNKNLKVKILNCHEGAINCTVIKAGTINSHDGLQIKNRKINNNSLTEYDYKKLKILLTLCIDAIAFSFVENKEYMQDVQRVINNKECFNKIKIISKIETTVGLNNLDHILEYSDGIMIGRGDFSREVGINKTNDYIYDLLNNWENKNINNKILMLASLYFYRYLFEDGILEADLKKQNKAFTNAFVIDESTYADWKKINEVVIKENLI